MIDFSSSHVFCCSRKRVLKPPGGGSSDIFGTCDTNVPSTGGNKKYVASQFSLGNMDSTEQGSANGVGLLKGSSVPSLDSNDGASVSSQTSSNSNGTPDNSEPNTPRSGTPQLSNGPISYDNHHSYPAPLPSPSRPQGRRAQGNPVTGIGYNPEEEKKEETPRRQRVPPGGFSSKLW